MIIVNDIDQGTDDWFKAKAGIPSASNFNKIITSTGKLSATRDEYMDQLADEYIKGKVEKTYISPDMKEGNLREGESRDLYSFLCDRDVHQVGMVFKDSMKKYMCSPDGMILKNYDTEAEGATIVYDGYITDWGLELKNVLGKTQIGYLKKKRLPPKYFHQVQGSMLVTGLGRWDFFTYSPGYPPFWLKVERDEKFIKILEEELDRFCYDLAMLIKEIKEMA